jgi:hypothetical protein
MPSEIRPYRLLVEGKDDLHSVVHLMKRHGFDWDSPEAPWIEPTNGFEPLLRSLPIALKTYRRLGVILDANTSPTERWNRLRQILTKSGVAVDNSFAPGVSMGGPLPGSRMAFWLMPDNASPGAVEEFLSTMVPADDTCWEYASKVAAEARHLGGRCPEKYHLKSQLHTWLAWQEEPGNPFGTAVKTQVFRSDGELALRFVRWFQQLFVDD